VIDFHLPTCEDAARPFAIPERRKQEMPHYLVQVSYTAEGWAALLKKPQNRIEAVRPAVEKLGGKIEGAWFAFGESDVIVVLDMPDNTSAAALAMAFASGGACKSCKTTPLLTIEDGLEALKQGAKAGYKPATAK
jgi:uncharacterized protein with GYD domain